ncbi:hypothetical protein SeMB42_g07614 [Synchytrium endobioticum]|uniref:RING-type domain-containing protein n=1 Tax=Synchytrium endobioticum TaxID=286115 RepID=A0A507BS76_9FUNG|nr:hypothetical protein SeMB42_g07614 [Synchytrium endobioticum]
MKITTLFNMQTTRWATIPLVLVLMLPHLHQTSAVGNLRGHSDPDIRYSRNRQSHDQASYRNRDHSRPPTSSVEHVSRFQDNNQGPRYSTWNAQVAGFPGEYYQPDEDSPDRQWQDQVSGVSDNNQGPRSSTWNAQVAGFPGEYHQPDENSPYPQWHEQVSRFQDNNQGPSSSTWNAQVAVFPGEYHQPDELTLAVSQLSLEGADPDLTSDSSSDTGAPQWPVSTVEYQSFDREVFGRFLIDLGDGIKQMLASVNKEKQQIKDLSRVHSVASDVFHLICKYDPVQYGEDEEFQSIKADLEFEMNGMGCNFDEDYGTCEDIITLLEEMIFLRSIFIRRLGGSFSGSAEGDSSSNTRAAQFPATTDVCQSFERKNVRALFRAAVYMFRQLLPRPPLEDTPENHADLELIRRLAFDLLRLVEERDPILYRETEEFRTGKNELNGLSEGFGLEYIQDHKTCGEIIKLFKWIGVRRKAFENWTLNEIGKMLQPSAAADPGTCTICLTDFEPGENVSRLPCKHAYHPECIHKWLKEKVHCILCQDNLWAIFPAKY